MPHDRAVSKLHTRLSATARDEASLQTPVVEPLDPKCLSREELAALDMEVQWLEVRAEFERLMAQEYMSRVHCRNVFESDMICAIVLMRYIQGVPMTLKEMSTYFGQFVTEATLSRHLDDMEAAGALVRMPDPNDRRRLLLIPTAQEAAPAAMYLQGRLKVMLESGFVYDPQEAKRRLALSE